MPFDCSFNGGGPNPLKKNLSVELKKGEEDGQRPNIQIINSKETGKQHFPLSAHPEVLGDQQQLQQ